MCGAGRRLCARCFAARQHVQDQRGCASDRRACGSASLVAVSSCPHSVRARRLEGPVEKLDSFGSDSRPSRRLLHIRLFQHTAGCCDRLREVSSSALAAAAVRLRRRDLRLARHGSDNTGPQREGRAGVGTQRGSHVAGRRTRFSARCRREPAAGRGCRRHLHDISWLC